MECEICGADEGEYISLIEGARMNVCRTCSRMGKILKYPTAPAPKSELPTRPSPSSTKTESEFELVEGFGSKMKNARMKMKLPLAVLAEKLAEKESFLDRIEKEKTHPSPSLARKIEKELGITLIEESSPSSSAAAGEILKKSSSRGTTLGDILEIEKKKKK
ncbi:MAG: multiprotein bridging factor aMBF1 [Candidatus Micrarchaeota archaeon]